MSFIIFLAIQSFLSYFSLSYFTNLKNLYHIFYHISWKSIGIFIKKFRKYTCQSMSVTRIQMYPAKSHLVNSCAFWINPHLKVLFWQIVDRIILIFTAQSNLVLPFMAKCSNFTGWRYNMRYMSIYERWKFKQIRKQAEHRLFRWFFLYHILKTEYFLSYYFLS